MQANKRVKVVELEEAAQIAAQLAEFGRPLDQATRNSLLGDGFATPHHRAMSCMSWIWRQWLSGASREIIARQISTFVKTGLQLRELCNSYHKLPQHDLFLLHCAIFGSDDTQLMEVAEAVADTSGDKSKAPIDDGELYAAAWCGMMKHWVLGDFGRAADQFSTIWKARRDELLVAAPKPLVVPWLKKDWTVFVDRQKRDFEKLWNRARKDGRTIRSESSTEVVISLGGHQVGHTWCWAHCGMALLAYRQGIEVATDPLWFPPYSLKCVK